MTRADLHEIRHRLDLKHPVYWSAAQYDEAVRCTGCVVHSDDPTRHVKAVAGCPVHTGTKR